METTDICDGNTYPQWLIDGNKLILEIRENIGKISDDIFEYAESLKVDQSRELFLQIEDIYSSITTDVINGGGDVFTSPIQISFYYYTRNMSLEKIQSCCQFLGKWMNFNSDQIDLIVRCSLYVSPTLKNVKINYIKPGNPAPDYEYEVNDENWKETLCNEYHFCGYYKVDTIEHLIDQNTPYLPLIL
jgi:hypothetical protein